MNPLSPLDIEVMILMARGIPGPVNHVRPRIVEEPVPSGDIIPGPCAAVIGREMP
jgi:hypothetical protein